MRMPTIGMLFFTHSFSSLAKIRDYTKWQRWQVICIYFPIFHEDSCLNKNKSIPFQGNPVPYSYSYIDSAALTREGNNNKTTNTNGTTQEEKGDYLCVSVRCTHNTIFFRISCHTVNIYLFYEQQWTRSGFAFVKNLCIDILECCMNSPA